MNNKSKLTDTYYVAQIYYRKVKRSGLGDGPILTTTIIRERKDGNYIDCRMPSAILNFDKGSRVPECPKSIDGYVYRSESDAFELAKQPSKDEIFSLIEAKRRERHIILCKHVPHVRTTRVEKKDTK